MQKTALKFILSYLKKLKTALFFIVISAFIARFLSQAGGYVLAKSFDWAATKGDASDYWQTLLLLLLAFICLDLIGHSVQSLSMWLASRIIPYIRSIVIKDVFAYVNRHSISFFTNEMAGNISNKFNQLQNGVVDVFFHCGNALFDFSYMIVGLLIIGFLNWIFGVVVCLWAILMFFVGRHFGRIRAQLSKETSAEQSRANAVIVDSISNYSEIKSFANYKYERTNLLKALKNWRKAETKEQKQKSLINFYLSAIATASAGFIILVSLFLFRYQQIDLTAFIFIISISQRLSGVVFGVNWSVNNLTRVFGQINSALETLAVEPDILDKPNAKKIDATAISIDVENIRFAYDDNLPVFSDFSLHIKAGEKVGIVGASGTGKSTLIKLISRYFDVTEGAIKINGIDIKDIAQDSLHKHIAVIPQDVCLFNRTIADNIRYGKIDATFADIAKAATSASADKFITKFACQYETKVGDRGVILSGGERQRIAIARALLKNAPVLIFDEATSSLDSESEKYIQSSLKILMQNKTVLAVAHRLSTLREMDRIIVLENGKIVEEGSHLALLRQKGRYAALFRMQSDGYLNFSQETNL